MLDVGDQDGGGPAVVDAGGEGVEAEGHVDDEGSGDVAEAAGSGCRCGRRRRGWGGEKGGPGVRKATWRKQQRRRTRRGGFLSRGVMRFKGVITRLSFRLAGKREVCARRRGRAC